MASTSSDFVGRAELLRRLALVSASDGDLFELVGGSGSGKTAIVAEASQRASGLRAIRIDLESYDPERPGDHGFTASVGSVAASFHQLSALLTRLVELGISPEAAAAFEGDVHDAYQAEVAGQKVFGLEMAVADVRRDLTPAALARAWHDATTRVIGAFVARWNAPGSEGRFLVFDNVDDVLDEELGARLGEVLAGLERTAIMLTRRPGDGPSLVTQHLAGRAEPLALRGWEHDEIRMYLERQDAPKARAAMAGAVRTVTRGHPGTIVAMVDLLARPGLDPTLDLHALLTKAAHDAETDPSDAHEGPDRSDGTDAVPRASVASLLEGLVLAQRPPRPLEVDYGHLLWRCVQAAAVTRRFDARVFGVLVAAEAHDGIGVPELFDAVCDLRFIERIERPDDAALIRARTGSVLEGGPDGPGSHGASRDASHGVGDPHEDLLDASAERSNDQYRVYRYVRDAVLDRMASAEEDRFYELHELAAAYHHRQLVDEAHPDLAVSYGSAFVYEDPAWQRHKREWLYHLSHARSEGQRVLALRESTRLFLEAFWWWGSYVHFDFCDQLIADLSQVARRLRGQGRQWLPFDTLSRALDRLVQAYPPRSAKVEGRWDEVAQSLDAIATACGLESPRTAVTATDFRILALVEVLRAHVLRFGGSGAADRTKADRFYAAATAHFARAAELAAGGQRDAAPVEDWNAPWMAFERAELATEVVPVDDETEAVPVDEEQVRAHWIRAAEALQAGGGAGEEDEFADLYGASVDEGPDGLDRELIANLHRLRGDRCVAAGDHLRAATWYRRALLHAYFANAIGTPADLAAPDEYTLQFYVEVRARVLTRIQDLLDQDEGLALDFAVEVAGARWWDTVADRSDPDGWRQEVAKRLRGRFRDLSLVELGEILFLPGPRVEQLGPYRAAGFLSELRARRSATTDSSHDLLDDERWP